VEEAVVSVSGLFRCFAGRSSDASPPKLLAGLNYIFFYREPKRPGSGFGRGLAWQVDALNTDLDWLRDHTRYLQRATERDAGDRLIGSCRVPTSQRPRLGRRDGPKVRRSRPNCSAQRLQEIAEAQAERGKALAER
jgi:hypothetical protein